MATIVGVVTILACILVGGLLIDIKVSIASTIGSFLKTYSTAIGLVSAIWWYCTH